MNYTKIPRDSWSIIEKVLMRYPDQKKEYTDMIEQIVEGSPFNDGLPRSNYPGNRLEAAVIKLQSPRMQRIEREVQAVERAYNALGEEQRKVIRIRYWSRGWKKIPYLKIRGCNYSECQMKRIVFRVIDSIGRDLGEIE